MQARHHKELSARQVDDMARLRLSIMDFIHDCGSLGTSRELALAVTNAEQALMWANKHIALRDEPKE